MARGGRRALEPAGALRGYDAVHLASALAIDAPGELIVATWDEELAAAVVAEGRMVVPAL
ncbi:MAG TPA: hypothetical protein VFU94_00725 [Conexibacter sp.]|nr:hypothetical protein [Conexibacter sp.]